jgi:hypothetical protein
MCCGPCSIYPIKELIASSVKLTGYFYNPNIHPKAEFQRRLLAVKKLSELMDVNVILNEEYAPEPFFDALPGTDKKSVPEEKRCRECYAIRLDKTARAALSGGFNYFTSSLLYSRFQNHETVIELGLDAEARHGVPFYYEDYRKGWREGIEDSKDMGLYRQKYCGCIFSFIDRGLHHKDDNKKQG